MKTTKIIKAIKNQWNERLNSFITDINKVRKIEDLNKWIYNDLLPKGKVLQGTLKERKEYLIGRKTKEVEKKISRDIVNIEQIFGAGELISVKIQLEWVRNRTWGNCPKGEAWILFKNANGDQDSKYITCSSVTGCGYDKQSTTVANLLNQVNEVLKPLYVAKEKKPTANNHELLGYGSGYGIEPRLEGGVGVNCFPRIFDKVGFKFETVASGSNFDVYTITKK